MTLKAPFPWFGGKSRVAAPIWERFGDVRCYIEPFFGSGAALLGRPHADPGYEIVNDKYCFLANFWRALKYAPNELAEICDWPINEADLHARHIWLRAKAEWLASMMDDPDFYDLKVAAWWVWGISQWIGSGWCDLGPPTASVKRPYLASDMGAHRPRTPTTSNAGVYAKRPDLCNSRGIARSDQHLIPYFSALSRRFRNVKVCCGDWKRVLTDFIILTNSPTGILLDPPYGAERDEVYSEDSFTIAGEVREWAIEYGPDPRLRIALCGYAEEHAMPQGWEMFRWKAQGGYANLRNGRGKANRELETIWFSPGCLRVGLFPLE